MKQNKKIEKRFSENGLVTREWAILNGIGRLPARIHELRSKGMDIQTVSTGSGTAYQLRGSYEHISDNKAKEHKQIEGVMEILRKLNLGLSQILSSDIAHTLAADNCVLLGVESTRFQEEIPTGSDESDEIILTHSISFVPQGILMKLSEKIMIAIDLYCNEEDGFLSISPLVVPQERMMDLYDVAEEYFNQREVESADERLAVYRANKDIVMALLENAYLSYYRAK